MFAVWYGWSRTSAATLGMEYISDKSRGNGDGNNSRAKPWKFPLACSACWHAWPSLPERESDTRPRATYFTYTESIVFNLRVLKPLPRLKLMLLQSARTCLHSPLRHVCLRRRVLKPLTRMDLASPTRIGYTCSSRLRVLSHVLIVDANTHAQSANACMLSPTHDQAAETHGPRFLNENRMHALKPLTSIVSDVGVLKPLARLQLMFLQLAASACPTR